MDEPQKTRVLVVEDEAVIAALLQDFLEEAGYEVVLEETGAAALRAHTAGPCEVAIVDYGLPDMNGLEVCQQLGPSPSGSRPRVVLATGWGLIDEERLDGVVDLMLQKPFNMGQLMTQLERLIGAA